MYFQVKPKSVKTMQTKDDISSSISSFEEDDSESG